MKYSKSIFPLLIFLLASKGLFSQVGTFSQSSWMLPIYFEEGSGQRDTITLIWDSLATSGKDSIYGEHLKDQITDGLFHVYIISDSTKVLADSPLLVQTLQVGLNAINYNYPIKVWWDASLFKLIPPIYDFDVSYAVIQNDYFFLYNNDTIKQGFSMLKDSMVQCNPFSFGSQDHFPLYISIDDIDYTSVNEEKKNQCFEVRYKNPTIYISSLCNENIREVTIYSIKGDIKYQAQQFNNTTAQLSFDLRSLNPGLYLISISTETKNYCEKFIWD